MYQQNTYKSTNIQWQYQIQTNDVFNAQYQQFLQSFRTIMRNIIKQSNDATRQNYSSNVIYSLQFIQTILDILPFDGRPCTFSTYNQINKFKFFQHGIQILEDHYVFIRRIQELLYPNKMRIYQLTKQLTKICNSYQLLQQQQFANFIQIFHNQFQLEQTDPSHKIDHILMPEDSQVLQSYQDLQNIFLSIVQQCRVLALTNNKNLTQIKAVAIMISKKQQRLQTISKNLQIPKHNILLRSQVFAYNKIKVEISEKTVYNQYQNKYVETIGSNIKAHKYANSKYVMYVSILNYMEILCSRIIRMIKIIIQSMSKGIDMRPLKQNNKTKELSYFARLNFSVTRKIRLWGLFGRFAYMQLTQSACKTLFQQYDTFYNMIKSAKGEITAKWQQYAKRIGDKITHSNFFGFISENYKMIKAKFTNLKNIVFAHQNTITQARNNLKVVNKKVQHFLKKQIDTQKIPNVKQNLQIMTQLQNIKSVLAMINKTELKSLNISKSQFSAAINVINNQLQNITTNNTYLFTTQKALAIKNFKPLVQISKYNPQSKIQIRKVQAIIKDSFSLQSQNLSSKIINAYQQNMQTIQNKLNLSLQYLQRIQGNTNMLLTGQQQNKVKLQQISNFVQSYINKVSQSYTNVFGNSNDSLGRQIAKLTNQSLQKLINQNIPKQIAFSMSQSSQQQLQLYIQQKIKQAFDSVIINRTQSSQPPPTQQNIQYLLSNANYALASAMQMNLNQGLSFLNMNQNQVTEYILSNQQYLQNVLQDYSLYIENKDQNMMKQVAITRSQIRQLGAVFSSAFNTYGLNQEQKRAIGGLLSKVDSMQPVVTQIYNMISMIQQNLNQIIQNDHTILQQNYIIWSTLQNINNQVSALSNNMAFSFRQFDRKQNELMNQIYDLHQENRENHQYTRTVVMNTQKNIQNTIANEFLKFDQTSQKQSAKLQQSIKQTLQKFSTQSKKRQEQQKQLLKTNTKLVQQYGMIKSNFQKVVQQINDSFLTNFDQSNIKDVLEFIADNKNRMNKLKDRNAQFQLNIKSILNSIGSTGKQNVYRDAIMNHIEQLKLNNNRTQRLAMTEKHVVQLKMTQLQHLTQQGQKDQSQIKKLTNTVKQYEEQLQQLRRAKTQLSTTIKMKKQVQQSNTKLLNITKNHTEEVNDKVNQLSKKLEKQKSLTSELKIRLSTSQEKFLNMQKSRNKLQEGRQSYQQQKKKMKTQIQQLKQEIHQSTVEQTKLKQALRTASDQLKIVKESQASLKKQIERINSQNTTNELDKALALSKQRQTTIKIQLDKANDLLRAKQQEHQDIKQRMNKQVQKSRQFEISIAKYQAQNQGLKDSITNMQKDVAKQTVQINKMQSIKDEFQSKQLAFARNQVDLQNYKSKYNQANVKIEKLERMRTELQQKNARLLILQNSADKQKQLLSGLQRTQRQYQQYKRNSQQDKSKSTLNVNNLNNQIQILKSSLNKTQSQINLLVGQIAQKESLLMQQTVKSRKYELQNNRNISMSSQYKSRLQTQSKKVQDLQKKVIQLQRSNDQINKLKSQIRNLKSQIQYKNQKLLDKQKDYDKIKQLMQQKSIQLKNKQNQYNQLNIQVQKLRLTNSNQQKALRKQELKLQSLAELQKNLAKSKQELIIYKNKVQTFQKQIESKNNQIIRLKTWQQFKSKFQMLQIQFKNLQKQVKETKNKLMAKQSQIQTLNITKDLYQKQKNKLQLLLKVKQQQLERVENQSSDIKKNNLIAAQNIKVLTLNINTMNIQIQSYSMKQKNYTKKIQQLNDQINKYSLKNLQIQDQLNVLISKKQILIKSHNQQLQYIKQQGVIQQKKLKQIQQKLQNGCAYIMQSIINNRLIKQTLEDQTKVREQFLVMNQRNKQNYKEMMQKWNQIVNFNKAIYDVFPQLRRRNDGILQNLIIQKIKLLLQNQIKNQQQIQKLNNQIQQNQKAFKKNLKDLQAKQIYLTQNLDQYTQKSNKLQVQLTQKKTQIKALTTANEELKYQIETLKLDIQNAKKKIQHLDMLLDKRNLHIKTLQKQNSQLQAGLNQKFMLEKTIRQNQKLIAQLRLQISESKNPKQLVNSFKNHNILQDKNQQLQNLKNKLADYKSLQLRLDRSNEFIKRYQKIVGLIIKDLTQHQNSYEYLDNKVKNGKILSDQQAKIFSSYNIYLQQGNRTLQNILIQAHQNNIQLKAEPQQQSTIHSINQRSKIENQRSKIESQRSKIENQKSKMEDQKSFNNPIENLLDGLNFSTIQMNKQQMNKQQFKDQIKIFKKDNVPHIYVPQKVSIPKQSQGEIIAIENGMVIPATYSQKFVQQLQAALIFLTQVLFKLLQKFETILFSVQNQINVWHDVVKKLNKQNNVQNNKYKQIAQILLNLFQTFDQILKQCFVSLSQQNTYNAFVNMSTIMFKKRQHLKRNKNQLVSLIDKYKNASIFGTLFD